MARTNQSRHETAFTVSIEAREGVTTGISAHDRARTIAVAIDHATGAGRHRHPRPRLSAARARGRRAGARRAHRGRGRHRAAGRHERRGRDLRDHERGRQHGAPAGPGRLRAAARAQDRHDLRPDRLSAQARQPDPRGRAGDHQLPLRRRVAPARLQRRARQDGALSADQGRLAERRPGAGAHACARPAPRRAGPQRGPHAARCRTRCRRSPPKGGAPSSSCAILANAVSERLRRAAGRRRRRPSAAAIRARRADPVRRWVSAS